MGLKQYTIKSNKLQHVSIYVHMYVYVKENKIIYKIMSFKLECTIKGNLSYGSCSISRMVVSPSKLILKFSPSCNAIKLWPENEVGTLTEFSIEGALLFFCLGTAHPSPQEM